MARQGSVALSSGGGTGGDAPVIDVTGYTEIPASNNKGTFTLPIPAETPEGKKYRVTVVAEDSIGNRSAATSMETITSTGFIVAPTVTSPVANAGVSYKNIIVTTSPFASAGLSDTHVASQFVLLANDGSEAVIADSGEVSTLRTHTFTLPEMPSIVDCKIQARHKGAIAGWSAMSEAVPCTVKDSVIFITMGGVSSISSSEDGSGFSKTCDTLPSRKQIASIVYFKGKYYAVSGDGTTSTVYSSVDATDWEIVTTLSYVSGTYNYGFKIWKDILFLCGPQRLYKTTDGISWTQISAAPSYNSTEGYLSPVVWNKNYIYYCAGVFYQYGVTPACFSKCSIFYSSDGTDWKEKVLVNVINTSADAVAGQCYNPESLATFSNGSGTLSCYRSNGSQPFIYGYMQFDETLSSLLKKTGTDTIWDDMVYNNYGFTLGGKNFWLSRNGWLHQFSLPTSGTSLPAFTIRRNLGVSSITNGVFIDGDIPEFKAFSPNTNSIISTTDGENWKITPVNLRIRGFGSFSYYYNTELTNHFLLNNSRYYSSNDLSNWTGLYPGVSTSSLASIGYNTGAYYKGKIYLFPGTNNYIAESVDGINFTATPAINDVGGAIAKVANDKLFIVYNHTFKYYDGLTWSPKITNSPSYMSASYGGFAGGNSIYMMGDQMNTSSDGTLQPRDLYWSQDLVTWNQVSCSGKIPWSSGVLTYVTGISYGGGSFVIILQQDRSPFNTVSITSTTGKSVTANSTLLSSNIVLQHLKTAFFKGVHHFISPNGVCLRLDSAGNKVSDTLSIASGISSVYSIFNNDNIISVATNKGTYISKDGISWVRTDDDIDAFGYATFIGQI